MINATMERESSCHAWGERDWWPLTRLLIVGLAFGLLTHWKFGWNPVARDLWALPGGILTIFSFILLLSSTMAHFCLVALAIPMCGIIMLNDWLYDLSLWLCRGILRMSPGPLLALVGLSGEIALFGGLGLLVRRLVLKL